MDALISCLRAALLFRAAPSSLSADQAQRTAARGARSVRDLHARTHVRTARALLHRLHAAVVHAAGAPVRRGPRPCGRPLSPHLRHHRAVLLRSRGRWGVWGIGGGGRAAAALAFARALVTCDLVAFLMGMQQPDSSRTHGR